MGQAERYRVASENVHSQVFDDEVVVIDMASGLYFSLRGAAVDVWAAVSREATRDDIVTALQTRYEAPDGHVAAAADDCLGELVGHGLIVVDHGAIDTDAPEDAPTPGAAGPFVEPVIERFTDMRELLLLDPIHDVSESGWPTARAKES